MRVILNLSGMLWTIYADYYPGQDGQMSLASRAMRRIGLSLI
jgi:hypothetical protein